MITTQETIFALVAVAYGIAGLFLLYYTDKVSKQIKRHEEEHKARRAARIARHHDEHHADCNHEDENEPLLGVIYPPTHGYGRRHGKR